MENENNYLFARILSMKDIGAINHAQSTIEGLAYAVQDPDIADGLVGAIENIEAILDKENKDG